MKTTPFGVAISARIRSRVGTGSLVPRIRFDFEGPEGTTIVVTMRMKTIEHR
jgi:hypothetical protein